ncbi:hypothetical protein UA08_02376 [Talaromyces atroroseus]|uniref:Uncharacterized protein n=1 Tax=Talaromyces atroroseus TaxID=1441469 RepID=A0A225AW47_TALAT|nr:hypothetical protein UA08_02376 [Talaromyces atroroseus]OKL62594.1 hypothetical protein UA08_02376 [Talaromyces atroroseus]
MSSRYSSSQSRGERSYHTHEVQYIEREPSTSYRTREIPHTRPQPIMRRESDSYNWKEPSYYGPDFQNVEKGLSSSFSLPRRTPKEPIPYVKRPDPYPPHVLKEYDYYKMKEKESDGAYAEFKNTMPKNGRPRMPKNQEDVSYHHTIIDQGTEVRRMANDAAMSRSGFIQKYPYSYAHFDDKNHWKAADNRKANASRIARSIGVAESNLEIYDQKQKGIRPTKGLSKEDYKRKQKEDKYGRH